jgi:hypothetical protein
MYFQNLVMRYTFPLYILLLVACGKTQAKKEIPVSQNENKTVEFQFTNGLRDYKGKTLGITGFIWTDPIGSFLKKGGYIVFERPNCFECGQVMTEAKTDISIVQIEDTGYVNPFKGWNWRLVKISGVVDNERQLTIDRTEVSEYSYPDYENSGFVPVSGDYLKYHAKDKDLVYIDAAIDPKMEGYAEDISVFKLTDTGIEATGWAILHNGNAANLAYKPADEKTNPNAEIRDMDGNLIGNKKVRLYGVLDYDTTKPHNFTVQVEAIRFTDKK